MFEKMIIFAFNIVLISSFVSLISADYSYKNADEWKNENPTCGGQMQSPIEIFLDLEESVEYEIDEIHFEHIYDTVPKRMTLKNDGHTRKTICNLIDIFGKVEIIKDDEKNVPYVWGDLLEKDYTVHGYEFHWSSDINSGSEHHLSGRSYSLEMQIVTFSDEFGSYEEAEDTQRGLLICSLFFEVGSEEFEFLETIVEKLPEVTEPGTTTEIEPFAMGEFFNGDPSNKIIYDGSLTHPPCFESVVWVITDKVIPATEEQLLAFRKLKLLYNDDHNNRPLQERNDRKFYFSD